jgi:hypothetical protein
MLRRGGTMPEPPPLGPDEERVILSPGGPAPGPRLYTPTTGVQDREAFRAMLTRLDIDSHLTQDNSGQPTVALDRTGMEQLATWFADHGDTVQADAIQRALDA